MKKRILGVAFGVAVVFLIGTTTITEAEAGSSPRCGSGDRQVCCEINNVRIYYSSKPIITFQ